MNRSAINVIRIAGLLTALASAIVAGASGDFATAGGIIGAALSAAGLKGSAKQE